MSSSSKKTALNSAAWELPSRVFTYRFFLSVCLFLCILASETFRHSDVGVFILLLINVVFCADVFLRVAWKDLLHGKLSFAVFVCASVGAGFLFSAWKTILPFPIKGPVPDLFLYTSFFLTLSLWGQRRFALEKEQAHVFIKKLDDFLPKSGRLCVGRNFRKVFAKELHEGDLVFVKTGERLPCDGIIRKGKTSIDEQLISGNMLPTSKRENSTVYAGTLNKSAEVYVEVTQPLGTSALMSVIDAVKHSELRRSHFKSILDTLTGSALPIIFVGAVCAYSYTLYLDGPTQWIPAIGVFLTVMALCSPIALLFASVFPVFFVKSGARAIKLKIQNIHALREIVEAETFFFDKTGTLTYGELRVSGVFPAKPNFQHELLETVATAEQWVDGPFANAVNEYAKEHKIEPRRVLSFEVLPGLGIQARSQHDRIFAGRAQWIEEQGVKIPVEITQVAEAIICVLKNGRYLGYLTLSDEVRPGVHDMIDFLKKEGKDIILVSGDNEASVSAVSTQVGIEKINFNVLPKTKAEIITNLRSLGKKVIMVGDGFNDIIALLRADAGIVFSSGRNVYNNWVDIIIKRKDLYPLMDLFKIDKKLRRTIFGNVLWALLLNGALTAWLFWRSPQENAWQWTLGGSLVVVVFIWLYSTRLLKIK